MSKVHDCIEFRHLILLAKKKIEVELRTNLSLQFCITRESLPILILILTGKKRLIALAENCK